ncbi:hypothetical protein [Cryptosporangium sp. NPDC048952]|uniref:hypothetical protein n=1 Tax=Cryptosporangium sp. NPDC048952 TaxID=3363961 RepID=UPI0037144EFB
MVGAAPMSDPDFRDLLHKVERKLEEADRKGREIFAEVARVYPFLGPFKDDAEALLAKIKKLWDGFWTEMVQLVTSPGVPWTLWAHGNDWSGPPIGGTVSKQAGRATANALGIDNYWHGQAADAYKDTLGPQKEALTWIKTVSDEIDDILTKVAVAIITLWVTVLGLIVTLVIELTAEAVAAGTLVGAVPAAIASLASWTKVIAGVSLAIGVLWAFLGGTALASFKDLRQRLYDSVPFPEGRWPKATSEYTSDGSITDGDTTAWRLTT